MKIKLLRLLIATLVILVAVSTVFLVEVLLAMQGAKESPFINPGHAPVFLGTTGPALRYVVMGDSTGAGRGAGYSDGIAMGTTRFLARDHKVAMTNLSISGAVIADVVRHQLPQAVTLKPNVVLLSVGANDATHFTSGANIERSLDRIIKTLRQSLPNVKIIVTGCPQMGSVPRFQQPLRWFAGTQTWRINQVFKAAVHDKNVGWAHIADRTGKAFANDPTLFSPDKFHPNARGYALWTLVINESIRRALAS